MPHHSNEFKWRCVEWMVKMECFKGLMYRIRSSISSEYYSAKNIFELPNAEINTGCHLYHWYFERESKTTFNFPLQLRSDMNRGRGPSWFQTG